MLPTRGGGEMGVDRGFKESTVRYVAARKKRAREPGGLTEDITFFKLDEGDSVGMAAAILFRTMMDMARADKDMDSQMCAYILSAVNIWFPMWDTIERFMTGLNWNVTVVKYPTEKPDAVQFSQPEKWRDTLITFGQVILIFFKNISDVNYATFMLKRVKAIASLIGHVDSPNDELALKLESAKVIKRVLGSNPCLKKELIEYMLTTKHQISPMGRMCGYISEIVAWNEMTYIQFMFEELVVPSSPVLSSPEVVAEVRNLAIALFSTLTVTHPQYYKILGPSADQKFLERKRFPVLIEVSRRLKEGKSMPAQNFQGSANVNPNLVNRLLTLHRGQLEPSTKLKEGGIMSAQNFQGKVERF